MVGMSIEKAIVEFKAANGEFKQDGKYAIIYAGTNGSENELYVDCSECESMTAEEYLKLVWDDIKADDDEGDIGYVLCIKTVA